MGAVIGMTATIISTTSNRTGIPIERVEEIMRFFGLCFVVYWFSALVYLLGCLIVKGVKHLWRKKKQ